MVAVVRHLQNQKQKSSQVHAAARSRLLQSQSFVIIVLLDLHSRWSCYAHSSVPKQIPFKPQHLLRHALSWMSKSPEGLPVAQRPTAAHHPSPELTSTPKPVPHFHARIRCDHDFR